jgi:murein DD-endopeptidase MepM/ murein hydrolase activator NlpD
MAHRWAWPLSPQPRIVRLFSRPQQRYGPGHRGLDLEGQPGALVRAVDAGTVTHVGVVAGRGTVTLVHASGLRSTYEPVTASVKAGQAVGRGAVLGHLVPEGGHCPGRVCLHLGAIQLSDYIDPLPLLERHGVRLLPLR